MPDSGSFDPSSMFGDTQNGSQSGDKSSFGGGFNFGGMGGFGMGSSDVKLQYIDDNASSYSNIWNNAKTDITENDQSRLIDSLKKLSNGEQIESVVDIESVIRYFVVHNYVCNGDSYTGMMVHNYYLYEENGQMAMIPWDYNLAFGTFSGGSGQSTVNTPIDAPVSGGTGEDRPMWHWILSDESYTDLYHQYYAEFIETVDIQSIIDNAYNLIKSYVEKDPTAFYTYEEFEKGVETMRRFCVLRSESISMQLANGETASNMSYVDASDLTLSDMGSMGGSNGGFGGNMPDMGDRGNFGGRTPSDRNEPQDLPDSESTEESADVLGIQQTSAIRTSTVSFTGYMPSMPEGFDTSQMPGDFGGQMPDMGEIPEGFDPSQMPGDFGGSIPGSSYGEKETAPSDTSDSSETTDGTGSSGSSNRPSRNDMQTQGGNWGFGGSTTNASSSDLGWIWINISVLILAAGIVVAKIYKY